MSKKCDFMETSNDSIFNDYFYHEIDDGLKDLENALVTVTMPVVSVLGVIGNVLSFLIFRRQGLKKSCNILILSLAVGDTLLLLGINNVALRIYMSDDFGFHYSRLTSQALFVAYHVQKSVYIVGRFLSTLLPMFITLERFLAIFFPLKFSRIVSPFRTKVAAGVLFVASLPFSVYFATLTRFVYQTDTVANCSLGRIVKSPSLLEKAEDYNVMVKLYVALTGSFPVFFVLTGCFIISVKLRILATRRKQLTNTASPSKDITENKERIKERVSPTRHRDAALEIRKSRIFLSFISKLTENFCRIGAGSRIARQDVDKKSSRRRNAHRTTKTLLSVCLLYSVVYTFKTAMGFIFGADDWSSDLRGVLTCLGNLAMSINSSANFLIYVALNPKFRETFKAIFSRAADKSRDNHFPTRPTK